MSTPEVWYNDKEYMGVDHKWYPWYDLDRFILSRQPVIGFDIGSRGIGKTTGWSQWAWATWKNKGAMWVVLVRRPDELKAIKQGFWTWLLNEGWETSNDGIMCRIRLAKPKDIKADEWASSHPWQPFGFFLCMTNAVTYKQNSAQFSAYPIDKMLFDEFILEDPAKRYLETEPAPLTSIASSVFRNRPRRVTCFSNAGFVHNPYFTYYGVTSGDFEKTDFVWRDDVLFHYTRQPSPIVYSQGLRSGDRAYQTWNQFRDVTGQAVCAKPKSSRPWFNLASKTAMYRVYTMPYKGWLYVEHTKKPLASIPTYTLDPYTIVRNGVYDMDTIRMLKRTLHANKLRFGRDEDRVDVFDWL